MDDYVFQDPRSIRRITGSSRETESKGYSFRRSISSVCSAGKRSLRVVECFSLEGNGEKKKGKGRETSRREARIKFDARGT